MMNREELRRRQNLSLGLKETFTAMRIREWYEFWEGNVYISFSGGKDSTVLLHQVRKLFPEVPGVFLDTGLEFPEIRNFVRQFDNIVWIRPKKPFMEVINEYGYPVVSKDVSNKVYEIRNSNSERLINKRLYGDDKGNGKISERWKFLIEAPFPIHNYCCRILKKNPAYSYEKETGRKPFIGTMAYESTLRSTAYMGKGCNSFIGKRPISTPMAFWMEKDVSEYITKYQLPISSIYSMGYSRTGCMFCMFGIHLEKGENRFQIMKKTHPNHYDFCINKLKCGMVLDFLNIPY